MAIGQTASGLRKNGGPDHFPKAVHNFVAFAFDGMSDFPATMDMANGENATWRA